MRAYKTQCQLAETLLRPASEDEQITLCVIAMRQFGPDTQNRFQNLMDRNNEGQLSVAEYEELKTLQPGEELYQLVAGDGGEGQVFGEEKQQFL